MLAACLCCGVMPTAFAAKVPVDATYETSDEINIDVILDDIDLSQPYSKTEYHTDEDGNEITLTLDFTPAPQTRGSSSNDASVGTWTSSYSDATTSMSYKFDVSKSGTQWTISNARTHLYSGLFCTFSDPSLTISRATSTSSFPAEINATVGVSFFDNGWIHIYSTVWWMTTKITSDGTMTLYW